jgi:hypothetical protein
MHVVHRETDFHCRALNLVPEDAAPDMAAMFEEEQDYIPF